MLETKESFIRSRFVFSFEQGKAFLLRHNEKIK